MVSPKRIEERTLLIDGDSIAFKFNALQPEELEDAISERLQQMFTDTGSTHYTGFIGRGKDTYRHKLVNNYKSNRIGKTLPNNVKEVKDLLVNTFKFYELHDIEAEDGIGVCLAESTYKGTPIIAHIDSDVNQLEGIHYNYDKRTMYEVSKEEAMKYYWSMVIEGSHKDNVKGLYRFPKKNIDFSDCKSFISHYRHVYKLYTEYMTKQLNTVQNYMEFDKLQVIDDYFKTQTVLQKIKTYGKERRNYSPISTTKLH